MKKWSKKKKIETLFGFTLLMICIGNIVLGKSADWTSHTTDMETAITGIFIVLAGLTLFVYGKYIIEK